MIASLSAEMYSRLDSVSPAEWDALFPGHIDSRELLWLTAAVGMDQFNFGSIVVRQGDIPLLLLPLFHTRYPLADLVSPGIGHLVRVLEKLNPSLLAPRLLGVGFVEGEWSKIGVRPGLDPEVLHQAWQLAEKKLTETAAQFDANMIVLLNYRSSDIDTLPTPWTSCFTHIDSYPYGVLPLGYSSLDGYLADLSKATRKGLRSKMKTAADIEVVRCDDPRPWRDAIWEMYQTSVRQAKVTFGMQRRQFLEQIGVQVPGAHYVLYLQAGRLVAFNLLVEQNDTLVDKYFAADSRPGDPLGLYFSSWLQNIKYALFRGLSFYHAGPAAEQTKARLGCSFIPCVTLFRHRKALANRVLSALRPLIAYHPQGSAPNRLYAPDSPVDSEPTLLTPMAFTLDTSLATQNELQQRIEHRLDLADLANRLRLSAEPSAIALLRQRLQEVRQRIPGPWLTFIGSGDYHHLSLALLQTLRPSRPFSLVMIDNHPDWFFERPQFHCGNWLSGVWKLPWLERVILIGQDSDDFRPHRFRTAPFHQLCEGRLTLHPLRRSEVHALGRWPHRQVEPKHARRHWWGTTLGLRTVRASGAARLFGDIARSLAGGDVYLSVDKDCLAPEFAATDWEQGGLTSHELITAVRELRSHCRLIGVDVCGDRSPLPLKGLWKRLDAGRLHAPSADSVAATQLNQPVNLAILDELGKAESVVSCSVSS